MTSPYELLGVPVDASAERIRRAYELEVARAHHNGATRHAVDLSGAFDVLSSPARRALYDRHGFTAVRERSPGAFAPPTPWRIVKQQPLPAPNRTRTPAPTPRWRTAMTPVFALGIMVGLVLAAYVLRQASRPNPLGTPAVPTQQQRQVLCQPTAAGDGYVYSASVVSVPQCHNGATPVILSH